MQIIQHFRREIYVNSPVDLYTFCLTFHHIWNIWIFAISAVCIYIKKTKKRSLIEEMDSFEWWQKIVYTRSLSLGTELTATGCHLIGNKCR